jgi:hypothetical protein
MQKVYYDYTRLKFRENANVSEAKKIKQLLADAKEEINWVRSIMNRTDGPPPGASS